MAAKIEGSIVLVTGANRGIGKVITETFIAQGAAKVYAAVRDVDSAKPLVDAHGDKVVPIPIDLADPASIKAAAMAASDVQIVVNNAGVLKMATALDANAFETLDFELKINVYGLIHMAQAFAPVLKANGGGIFAQLNSVASLKSFSAFSTYCASKAAAYSITQALRELLESQNTQVVSVHPGPIDTDMGSDAGFTDIADSPQTVADGLIEEIRNENFHVFPDAMARQIGDAYEDFAENIIEANLMEA